MKRDTVDGMVGWWIEGKFRIDNSVTQTIVPEKIKELWYVYDWDNGYEEFDTEEKAHTAYLEIISEYRGEAFDGWNEETERVVWGKVFQTTTLIEVEPPEDYDELDDAGWAEAFAVEHRKCKK